MLNQLNLDSLNMTYVVADCNEDFDGVAVLECSNSWTMDQLTSWLPMYDFDMLKSVKSWLGSTPHIAEGAYLKVWID